jgi:uncharacterized membrane protein YfcA
MINLASALPMDLVLFFVATLLGAIVAGVAGFAFGLIASAIWLHIIPPAQSAPLIAVFAILIQGATLWKFRHAIRISRLFPFLLGGVMGIPLGAAVLTLASPDQVQTLIGAALILFCLYSLLRPKLPAIEGGRVADGIVGVMSGIFSGSTGLAGIPIIVWASLRRWSKDEQRAVFQPVVVAVFIMTLAWFGGTGVLTADTLRLFWIGLPAVLLGSWLGLKLYGRLNEEKFRSVVLALLLVSGATLLPWPWSKGV